LGKSINLQTIPTKLLDHIQHVRSIHGKVTEMSIHLHTEKHCFSSTNAQLCEHKTLVTIP